MLFRGFFSFSLRKQCVLLPSLLRKADTASVPDLVLRNSSYHTNHSFHSCVFCLGLFLGRELVWAVSPRVWFISVLWTVPEEDSSTLTGRAQCLSGTRNLLVLQEEPDSTRAASEHQHGAGRPHWVQTVLLDAELSAGGNCCEGWAGNWRMSSGLWRLFWALCPQYAFYLGSCSYFSSLFVASLQELRGHLLQHVLQQWTCTAIVS